MSVSGPNEEQKASAMEELGHVAEALKGLRFGQVIVTVQDGVVVQIDRTERQRFRRKATS